MPGLAKTRYSARLAGSGGDILACQTLRYLAFFQGDGVDCDHYDSLCRHVMVEENKTGKLVACFRLMPLGGGAEIGQSYSAQYYELSRLSAFEGPMVELGRFCIHPDHSDPTILRVAWGAMTRYVDDMGIELLFGCASFKGCKAKEHYDAFALLKAHHLAPKRWLPKVKAPDVFRFSQRLRRTSDLGHAMRGVPPLLRTYLVMGGWVSDHAVVDHKMDTLHVFTGVEIRSIPSVRKRQLRAIVG